MSLSRANKPFGRLATTPPVCRDHRSHCRRVWRPQAAPPLTTNLSDRRSPCSYGCALIARARWPVSLAAGALTSPRACKACKRCARSCQRCWDAHTRPARPAAPQDAAAGPHRLCASLPVLGRQLPPTSAAATRASAAARPTDAAAAGPPVLLFAQIGDRFTQLRDELEQSIEETIRTERFGVLPGAAGRAGIVGGRSSRAPRLAEPCVQLCDSRWPLLSTCWL